MNIFVTPAVAKRRLDTYGAQANLKLIDSYGHLELHAGQRIRNSGKGTLEANELRTWLNKNAGVDVTARHLYWIAFCCLLLVTYTDMYIYINCE